MGKESGRTPSRSAYLTSVIDAISANICPIHSTNKHNCDACQSVLTDGELFEALELANCLYRRWVDAGKPDRIDIQSTVTAVDRFGLALIAEAIALERIFSGGDHSATQWQQ